MAHGNGHISLVAGGCAAVLFILLAAMPLFWPVNQPDDMGAGCFWMALNAPLSFFVEESVGLSSQTMGLLACVTITNGILWGSVVTGVVYTCLRLCRGASGRSSPRIRQGVSTLNMTIDTLDRLPQILDLVHDRYFDLERVAYNKEAGTVTVPFGETKEQPVGRQLIIQGVREFQYDDTEQIGRYWFNKILINPARESLVIDCDILKLELRVSPEFQISVR